MVYPAIKNLLRDLSCNCYAKWGSESYHFFNPNCSYSERKYNNRLEQFLRITLHLASHTVCIHPWISGFHNLATFLFSSVHQDHHLETKNWRVLHLSLLKIRFQPMFFVESLLNRCLTISTSWEEHRTQLSTSSMGLLSLLSLSIDPHMQCQPH